jgi:hypothetical protein
MRSELRLVFVWVVELLNTVVGLWAVVAPAAVVPAITHLN